MCMLRYHPAIMIFFYFAMVSATYRRISQIFNIISNRKYNLICHQFFVHQFQCKLVCHFSDNQQCLLIRIRTLQHLTWTQTVRRGLILFYLLHCAWLPSPCMIDQQFCIHSKKPIKKIFIIKIFRGSHGTPRNISHRIKTVLFQLFHIASSDSPKICQWTMIP